MLGSFQALGTLLLTLLLGRLGDGGHGRETSPSRGARGLVVGQVLVWSSALLLTGVFPALAVSLSVRGAYLGCRSLPRRERPIKRARHCSGAWHVTSL